MTIGERTTGLGMACAALLGGLVALPAGGMATTHAADAAAGAAMESVTLGVGETATFGDGLRVFMSRVVPEEEMARVAVNGLELVTIKRGEAMEAEGCTLTLTGFEGGAALLDGRC